MENASYATGAYPLGAFPNDNCKSENQAYWVPPQGRDLVKDLRKAVRNTNWDDLFLDGKTKLRAEASWSANETRTSKLRALCHENAVRKVLEIGSFCGVATLAMAETLPQDGSIVALELDPYPVCFGGQIKESSPTATQTTVLVGPAMDSLEGLAKQMEADDDWEPFDFVLVDADKAGMFQYCKFLWDTPGLLSNTAVVCVDTTLFKGQLFKKYVKSGKADSWHVNSGRMEVQMLRDFLEANGTFQTSESQNLLVIRKMLSPNSSKRLKSSLASGAHPLATFSNDHFKRQTTPQWVASENCSTVDELRKCVMNANWSSLFDEGRTMMRADASWCAGKARCAKLQDLCASIKAERVLEVGSFCGVAALSIAEALPADGKVVALELDPYVAEFGRGVKSKSSVFGKIETITGPAKASLNALAQQAKESQWKPFDFVVIDADKAGMTEYFRMIYENPTMLSENAIVCVDTTPFKGQLFTNFVKHGKMDDWAVTSGQDNIDSFLAFAKSLQDVDVTEGSGVAVVRKAK